ncbi:hypothetical protein ANN_09409 [Periplaneta americana]|uniref:DUF4817 domain-containing protein n=1 Tax=Periplaneta americana TaxID=6978 RepID=A0ABQ8TLM0_PERAM|nr:hypothetical protein ANN_09409 [Periplaneta americana]
MKSQTVLCYAEFKSIVRVEREYRRVFNHDAPTAKSIKKWHDTFLATGPVLKKHGGGRNISDEMVANVRAAYERSPRKSLRRASRELQVPKSTLKRIVHKRLKLYTYKMQLMQRLEPDDKRKRVEFGNTMLDPAVIGPFSSPRKLCGTTYLDMLEQFFFPQTEHLQPNVLFQQDGAPQYWFNDVRTTLDNVFPGRWIVKSRSHTIIHDGNMNITANILGNHGNITTTPFPHILSYTSALHDCVLFANHVRCEQRSHLAQHVKGAKHQSNLQKKSNFNQTFMTTQQSNATNRNEFHSDLCRAIVAANIPTIARDIAFIKSHYVFLVPIINALVSSGKPVYTRLGLIEEVTEKINLVPGYVGEKVSEKLKSVLQKTQD